MKIYPSENKVGFVTALFYIQYVILMYITSKIVLKVTHNAKYSDPILINIFFN